MNLIEDLTCKHCKDIFIDPVTLNCCGENVCKKHIDETLSKPSSTTLACPNCCSELEIKVQKFPINTSLKNLVERELHKIAFDPKCEKTYKNFKNKIENIESIHKDPENIIFNRFSELKNQIDLDRDCAIDEINQLAGDLIKRLDSCQNELKNECQSKNNLDYYSRLIGNMRSELNEYEKCLKSLKNTDEVREKKSNEIEQLANVLDIEIKEYEKTLFKNKIISYEPMKIGVKNIFGKLNIVSLIFFSILNNVIKSNWDYTFFLFIFYTK